MRRLMLVIMGLFLLASETPGAQWTAGKGYRSLPVTVATPARPGFTLLSVAQTGLSFSNVLAQSRHLTNQILLNGSGVAAGDVDGDGWCDLYFCRLDGDNRLFRNRGQWRFEDITEKAGLAAEGLDASGSTFADIDGDRDLDLLVSSVGQGTHLYLNDGQGRFRRVTHPLGLNSGRGGTSLALGDLDGDGFLDLYQANYRSSALMDAPFTRFSFGNVNGRRVITHVNGMPVKEAGLEHRFALNEKGGVEERGEADALYRNLSGTNFARISFANGRFKDELGQPLMAPPFDWGLCVTIRDLNEDGMPDIFVCNDFDSDDRVWINQGNFNFRAIERMAFRKSSHFSMGADFADINRDGYDDLFVLDMRDRLHTQRMETQGNREVPAVEGIDDRPGYMMNTLFVNRGDGTYAEMSQLSGVDASDWAWSPVFLDVDLDGYEDLLVANGHERTARSLDMALAMKRLRLEKKMTPLEILQARKLYPRYDTPNLAFRNRGDLTFEEVGREWGFDLKGVSHGMALADLDNDGDLDVVVNNLNQPAALYRNNAPKPRILVRLRGLKPNTHGIGSRIEVHGGGMVQRQQVTCGGRYLSGDDTVRMFAATSSSQPLTLKVTWRSGRESVVSNAMPNHIYEIEERADLPRLPLIVPSPSRTMFDDVSSRLNHVHVDNAYDDFAAHPLLPRRLSRLGPGLGWMDLDADGDEDLFIAAGRGGTLSVYHNQGSGMFEGLAGAYPASTTDQTTVLGLFSGKNRLLVGLATPDGAGDASIPLVEMEPGAEPRTVAKTVASTGPMALADVDADGDLDLFVGGRLKPNEYPAAATASLYRDQGQQWLRDEQPVFEKLGAVSGAVFSDLDGDGDPDLALACDWGPIKVLRNDKGTFTDATKAWGMDAYTGWWNSITSGDFNGDGRLDLIAGNWGHNSRYEPYRSRPIRLYYGDLDGNGTTDHVESYYEPNLKKWVPARQLDILVRGLPPLRQRFQRYRDYAVSDVAGVLGDMMFERATVRDAAWLSSTVFLNRGNRFEARVLPVPAQVAPVFGLVVNDFNGDGFEDAFLAQNFFGTPKDSPRFDGGCGLLLQGDGRGELTPVAVGKSGIRLYGEQRGAAAADFDGDGRVDLAVAQNNARTGLFRNRHGPSGLRIRIAGPPGNPQGVGTVLRLGSGGMSGSAREVKAGEGYWSQNSAVQVLHAPQEKRVLAVRWPGGGNDEFPVPINAAEIRISPGKLDVVRENQAGGRSF